MLWKLILASLFFVFSLVFIINMNNDNIIIFQWYHDYMNKSDNHDNNHLGNIDKAMDIFTYSAVKDCQDTTEILEIRKHLSNALLFYHDHPINKKEIDMSNDFAYVTVIPTDHKTNSIVNETASAWCQSIRTTHSSYSNFDIVALYSSSSRNIHTEKYKCFDKLLFVDETVTNLFSNYTSVDPSVVSKLWMFSLVQYKRVLFMKHNLAPVRSTVYNYFFKDYYLSDGTDKTIYTPKKLYTQSNMLSPINTNFMTLEPNIDTAVDLLTIYALGKWDVSSGWMCYGPFDFDPVSRMESFEKPFEPSMRYQLNRKKEVHPWRESTWSFDASWSDTGLLFYYHYLLHPETSGVLYELDFDHSVIEYDVRMCNTISSKVYLVMHIFISH